ncbi:MAG: complex I subunit 4 family protein [Bdellovibrionota bacterium]
MIFFPLLGAMLQAFVPPLKGHGKAQLSRWFALIASLAASFCGIALVASINGASADLQASEIVPWIGSYAISYDMAVDGLNALLVLLISIIFPILVAAEWNQKSGLRGMHGLLLILQTALFGSVCAQDLFLQFFFWSLSALPFYFLIGIWGGDGREKAAFRSAIAAALGNALLFAALVIIYYSVDPHSFSLRELAGGKLAGKTFELLGTQVPVMASAFILIASGLALRAPIWPLHGWFTSVAEEAPLSVFVALCAVTVPVATYIFVRICYSLFPESLNESAKVIVLVGTINLVAGGITAVAQKGLRLLLAYMCLSEVGLVLIGIGSLSSAGVVGAVYHELIVGLGLAGFGLCAGILSERAGHATFIDENGERGFGGVATRAPAIAVVAGIVIASLLGFPGFAGFVGHALLVIGSFSVHPMIVAIAGFALLLSTYYLFQMYRSVFLGRPAADSGSFADLTFRERAYLLPLVSALLVFGLYPRPLIELVRPTVLTLLSMVK